MSKGNFTRQVKVLSDHQNPNLLQGACPANFAACGGLGDGLARARAGAAAVVVGAAAAAAAAAAHAGSGSGSGGVGHRGAAFAAEVAMLEGLSDSSARSFAKETEQIGDRVEGVGMVLTMEARVFAVVAAAAWAVAAAAALVRLNWVVRVKKEKRKGTRPREERVFYLPPGGMDKCSGKPIVRRNRMKSLSQPAKKIACVSSQLGRPVTHARFEGKNALEEGTITAHGQSAPGIQVCGDWESSL
ncbi:hypothetical protein NEUTE1DRAFT_98746 [Neurospora tetrasperma FGSC 2508]|uniref:Uncharacterized protein n=1 Tax=Neurospora tetrasperma (strain FGSC 2508 / ATCC MYA-4615 / P0657) TaxID=510951 RepID=F8MEP0_NEUT8|nr:uncharacterized protein NEUTE1DRAFT_98746 [Neurospora tetrasperma FGSC 2508]EGO61669.1 hypothetical protein NEUTE1DRAFT_98746 [Neurospora tetrasperma FGSC 2508]EGZ74280.1 hypothetical protein NEUTE2DRAFT_125256 [Neurospora tetrasperma FGSC 2509]